MMLKFNNLLLIIDINECLIDVCNNETEECINTLGSFSCICANGYRRWNGYCEGEKLFEYL